MSGGQIRYFGNTVGIIFTIISLCSFATEQDTQTLDSLTAKAESIVQEPVDSVLRYANKAIRLARKQQNIEALARNYMSIYKSYYLNGKMDSALKYAGVLRRFTNRISGKGLKAKIFHASGVTFYKTGEIDSALLYYRKEYELQSELGRLDQVAAALGNIGMANYRKGNYEKAIDNYFECLKLFEELGDEHKQMLTYNNIGDVYRHLEDYDKALLYYNKALELNKIENSKRFYAFLYNNFAIVYRKQKKYDSALVYYEKAKDIYTDINYKKGVATALTGIAITYNKLGNLDIASEKYLKAIELQKQVRDKIGLASNYGNLGILYIDKKDPIMAIKFLKKSDSLAKITGYRELQKNNYESFRDAYMLLGDYKKALDYEMKFVALKDSIYNLEKLREIENVREKYEAEQKQNRIKLLKEQAHLKDIKLSRKNIAIISLSVIIILIIIIGLLIDHSNKAKAKRNMIDLENKLLRSQMNPHFLFNSLNTIQTYILQKNPIQGASYLAKFAGLMRSILYNSREEFIPLKKELEMITNYLELQQVRFSGNFSYELKIDERIDTGQICIPPMLAQPFIENAIEHGFKNIDRKGLLKISIQLATNSLILVIQDNGIGVNEAEKMKSNKDTAHKSLATVISKERLKLFNKRAKKELFTLKIKQLTDEEGNPAGTEVRLVIPFKKDCALRVVREVPHLS